jgi:hypothetical protein
MKKEEIELVLKMMKAEEYTTEELQDKEYLEDRVETILEMLEIETSPSIIPELVNLYLAK